MKIPLVDLHAQYKSIKKDINTAVLSVIKSTKFILGPDVGLLEKEIAEYCGTEYAVAVASGTDALTLAVRASSIRPGDEVITSPFTFVATTEAIIHSGAVPVFSDIDPLTYNINSDKIEEKITKKTKAILPIHLFGHACDMDKITKLAHKYHLKIIEDCAQAMGTFYKKKHVGSIGSAGTLSFFPSKNLGCYGDGGMIITNNKELAERAKQLRNHGSEKKYYYACNGFNSRLDTIQASVLRIKLKHLNSWIKKRQTIADLYSKLIKNQKIIKPYIADYTNHSFNYYTVRITGGNRNNVQKNLLENGISTEIYYPLNLHLQNVYKSLDYKKGDIPIAEKYQDEVLSLPIYPELSEKEIKYICNKVNKSMA